MMTRDDTHADPGGGLPLIGVPQQKAYLDKLEEIATVLAKNIRRFKDNHGIGSERLGVVMFLFYYARFSRQEKYADIAYNLVSRVFDELNTGLGVGDKQSLAGFSALGWVMLLLEQEKFIDTDTAGILGDVEGLLHTLMIDEMKQRHYDYIHGALSKGLYFLSRVKDPVVRAYLGNLVGVIEEVSETDGNGGLKIPGYFPDSTGNEIFTVNLGLAHGMPSIIWFLSKIKGHGIAGDKATYLLDGFTHYIWHHSQDTTKYLSNFPRFGGGGASPSNSRLAWCYGDLGIGIGLWQAAIGTGEKDWETKALQVLLHSTGRRDSNKNGVADAGLCHGTAGIAHIYHRMHRYTARREFKEAAHYWFDETLKMAGHTGDFAGFEYQAGKGPMGWKNVAGILTGITGIGLALISAVSRIEPAWDRALLLS
jgi:lantibiotic modifying enzyme